jgi:hypothetical protein
MANSAWKRKVPRQVISFAPWTPIEKPTEPVLPARIPRGDLQEPAKETLRLASGSLPPQGVRKVK